MNSPLPEVNHMGERVYPIQLPLRYELRGREAGGGDGQTLAIGTRTVIFESDREFGAGCHVCLTIAWPLRLPDGAGLSLALYGTIIRCEADEIEVAVVRHEFRTRRVAAEPVADTPMALASAG